MRIKKCSFIRDDRRLLSLRILPENQDNDADWHQKQQLLQLRRQQAKNDHAIEQHIRTEINERQNRISYRRVQNAEDARSVHLFITADIGKIFDERGNEEKVS